MDLCLPWELQSSLLPSEEGAEAIRMQSASQAEKGGPASSFTRTEGAPMWAMCGHIQQWPPGQRVLRWSYRAEKSTRQQSDLLKLAVSQGQFSSCSGPQSLHEQNVGFTLGKFSSNPKGSSKLKKKWRVTLLSAAIHFTRRWGGAGARGRVSRVTLYITSAQGNAERMNGSMNEKEKANAFEKQILEGKNVHQEMTSPRRKGKPAQQKALRSQEFPAVSAKALAHPLPTELRVTRKGRRNAGAEAVNTQ